MTTVTTPTDYRPLTIKDVRARSAQMGVDGMLKTLKARSLAVVNNALIGEMSTEAGSGQGILAGIPIGVKDNIDVAGWVTTGGSPALSQNIRQTDAPAVARLRAAGAVLCCKLNMHELAFGATSDNAAFGPVRNPFDPNRTSGGSSGGSAAAVATGVVPVALGTDTGGSARMPASFCAIAGFRPSTGRYEAEGVLQLSRTRDTIGIFAAQAADIAQVDAAMSVVGAAQTEWPQRQVRLGLPKDALPGLSGAVERAFRAGLERLETQGVIEVVNLPPLGYDGLEQDFGFPIVFAEAHAYWEAFCADELGCSLPVFTERLGSGDVKRAFAEMPEVAEKVAGDLPRIRRALDALKARIMALYDDYAIDAIAAPTITVQPPRWSEAEELEIDGECHPTFLTISRNCAPASLIGAPSLSLPFSFDADGLPVGLLLDAPCGADDSLLSLGAYLEQSL